MRSIFRNFAKNTIEEKYVIVTTTIMIPSFAFLEGTKKFMMNYRAVENQLLVEKYEKNIAHFLNFLSGAGMGIIYGAVWPFMMGAMIYNDFYYRSQKRNIVSGDKKDK